MVATVVLLITQPRLSLAEMEEKKSSDRGTTYWIFGFASIGILSSVLEWSMLRQFGGFTKLQLIGMILILLSLSFRIYVIQILGKSFTATVSIEEDQRLIQKGPYSILRHPSYTGAWGYFLGMAIVLNSIAGFLIFFFGLWFAYQRRIAAEEKALTAHFGEEYLKYQARTFKMIPGIW
ncbi:MAG: isoprenylcysteine carboxylmethyltransferase family protein [Bacteroidia bacterium]|nr:isoprenylcysteine carboxylmethyltransferase family protein [Bacteroidia bacterium]